jgi:hypothetical protein
MLAVRVGLESSDSIPALLSERGQIGQFVLFRNFLTLSVIVVLGMVAIAGCNGDDDATDDVATDDASGATISDDGAEADDAAVVEHEDSAGDVADEATDDTDVEHDDVSVPDDFDGQVIEVTITDNHIEMDVSADEIEGGELYIIGTNEGSSEHGMAVRFPEQENPTSERSLQPGDSDAIHTFFEDPFIIYCPVEDHAEEHDMEIEIDPVI